MVTIPVNGTIMQNTKLCYACREGGKVRMVQLATTGHEKGLVFDKTPNVIETTRPVPSLSSS